MIKNGSRSTRIRQCFFAGLITLATVLAAPRAVGAATLTANGGLDSVIVRGAGPACSAGVDAAVAAAGGRVTRQLAILDGAAAEVPTSEVGALATSPCVAAVTPDGKLTLDSIGGYDPTTDVSSLYDTTLAIGAQTEWRQGHTGQGIGVALIDTGVAPVQGLNAQGQVLYGPDLSFDSQSSGLAYNDEYGHGTHMAGIIAGNDLYGQGASGSYAGNTSNFVGVAPDSHIISLKVGDENGVVDVSQVLAAIDWAVQHRNDSTLNIRVLNLSFGTTSTQAYATDPLAFAAEVAWRSGIVVVTAVGNNGSGANGVSDPAYDPYVLAVGAADTQATLNTSAWTVASFSSTGNGTRNPDVVAPGVHIASLRDPGSSVDLAYGSTGTVSSNTRFFRGSGTSQATAVVSGAAALFLQAHPSATPDQVKWALMVRATSLTNQPTTAQGSGAVNVSAAAASNLPNGHQTFATSNGSGSLEAARGGMHVVANGVALTGEQDIFGHTFNSAQMASAETSGTAWSAGTWNGTAWSGTGWSGTGWSGTAWSGTAWSGTAWSGTAWSGTAWSGSTWTGTGWSGTGWSGTGWSGTGWSGAGWSGTGWSGTGWSGTDMCGSGWSDYTWS